MKLKRNLFWILYLSSALVSSASVIWGDHNNMFKTLGEAFEAISPTMTEQEKKDTLAWSKEIVEASPCTLTTWMDFVARLSPMLTASEKVELMFWAKGQINAHPANIACFSGIITGLGPTLTVQEKRSLVEWLLSLDISGVEDGGGSVCDRYFEPLPKILSAIGATLTQTEMSDLFQRFVSEINSDELTVWNALNYMTAYGFTPTAAEKRVFLDAVERYIERHPDTFAAYSSALTFLGISLSDKEKVEHIEWAKSMATNIVSISNNPGPVFGQEYVIVSTNIVVHYLKQHDEVKIDPLPADSEFVAIVTEIDGNVAAVPSCWTTNYPSFVQKFGSNFAQALLKPTGKVGHGNVPLMVWQDYVAGTDPTDVNSRFSASINYENGHVVINWSPVVEDEVMTRIYTVYGKKKLTDASWEECDSDHYDDYNFFKVKVSLMKEPEPYQWQVTH